MRVTIEGRVRAKLTTNFQPAPGMVNGNHVTLRPQRHPRSAAIAMSLPRRQGEGDLCAVWDADTGKLLWVPDQRVSEICWNPDGNEAFALITSFDRAPRGNGVGHRLQRYSWPERQLLDELLFSVPSGGADHLVISASGKLAVVVAIEQGEYYYELLELRPRLRQRKIGHYVPEGLSDCPAFSPDERLLTAVGSPEPFWWCAAEEDSDEDDDDDESDEEEASAGGPHHLGTIYVHNLQKNTVREHPVIMDLPRGWHPHDPESGDWENLWGPVFVDSQQMRLWLPDGKPLLLTFPLPKFIPVNKRLNPAGRK